MADDNSVKASKPKKSKGDKSRKELEVAQDEIKIFKENLLQTGDTIISEKNTEPEESRRYSMCRARQSICVPDNVLAELDENKIFELKEAFLLFDLNGDGYIDHNDLCGTLISLGERVDEQAVKNMLAESVGLKTVNVAVKSDNPPQNIVAGYVRLDEEESAITFSGIIAIVSMQKDVIGLKASSPLDFDSFVNLLGYKTLELDSEETLIAALSRWDSENTGYISEDRIRHDLMTWGDRFTEKEADYALDGAPTIQKDGYTFIDYKQFCTKLSGLRKPNKQALEV